MRPATRCRHASAYKAIRPPKCGCDVCAIKWQLAELRKLVIETAERHERNSHELDSWF